MISADKKTKQINTDLLYADLTYKIRGAFFSVFNELGYGHKEQVYQKALLKEFEEQNIPYKREVLLSVSYKGEKVGNYRPDFVVGEKVVIELKAVEFVPNIYVSQLLNYLKVTGFGLGLLVNFGAPKLYIKRLINSYPRKSLPVKSEINPRESFAARVGRKEVK